MKKKKDAYLLQHKFDLKDVLLTETYSGFHGIWVIKDGDPTTYKKIQTALARKFGSDTEGITNLAKMLRINNFLHNKYPEKFLVKLIQDTEKVWTQEEIVKKYKLDLVEKQENGYREEEMLTVSESLTGISTIQKVKKIVKGKALGIEFKKPMPLRNVKTEMSLNDCFQSLKKLPLEMFLEDEMLQEGNVNCPFHNDNKESASVYVGNNGDYLFHCHACDVGTKNIVSLYRSKTGKGLIKSVKDLARIIGIKIIETEFEKEQMEKYKENRMFLSEDMSVELPNTWGWLVKSDRNRYLDFFNRIGETKFIKDDFQYKDQNVVFLSLNHIKREFGKTSLVTTFRVVQLLCILGFIEKVPLGLVHEDLQKRALKELGMKKEHLLQLNLKKRSRSDETN
ncbi:hypothetical protein QBX67_26970 [Bacillus sp. LS15-K4]|nr:hypothetical protein [Bacillus sp. LS15-K4]MDJ1478673.1 hypothetical protein [Bacillus sp. LS15-K4]